MTAKDKAAEGQTTSKYDRDAELAELAGLEARIAERRKQLAATGADSVPQSEYHTWPDGSSAVGVPPFPEKSPKQRAAELNEQHAVAHTALIPAGMKRSGEEVVKGSPNETESNFERRAEQQLAADVTSGKDPNTFNPTTSSDKPQLANMVTADVLEKDVVLSDPPTQEELDKMAAKIKPEGNFEATDEQKAAAVLQVARETKGPVVMDEKDTAAKKSDKK